MDKARINLIAKTLAWLAIVLIVGAVTLTPTLIWGQNFFTGWWLGTSLTLILINRPRAIRVEVAEREDVR